MKTRRPHVLPGYVIYGFFVLGLVSALAFRAIIILMRAEPDWVRPAWYVGITGYLLFFLYRYIITRKRKRAIASYGLLEKVRSDTPLSEEEREVVAYLLNSITSSMEDLNYGIIFVLSLLAILADLWLSLL